jgi:HSP20 family protein
MNHRQIQKSEPYAYPGEYVPMPEDSEFLECIVSEQKSIYNSKPLINMNEGRDCYKIEAMVPYAKRESIFINVEDGVLSIIILHSDIESFGTHTALHEFETGCLIQHIQLPQNADIGFVSAEYKEGILRILIPKTRTLVKDQNLSQIVVY